VVLTLKRVPKEYDGGERGVGGDGEIKIPAWHLVDLVDDEEGSGLRESGLPGGDTPVLFGGEMEKLLPFGPKLGGGNGDAELLAKVLPGKHTDEREGFSAPGEPGQMDEADGTRRGCVHKSVELLDGLSAFSGLRGEQRGEDTVSPVFHVGDEVLGTGDI
jgi:hypothetical protein